MNWACGFARFGASAFFAFGLCASGLGCSPERSSQTDSLATGGSVATGGGLATGGSTGGSVATGGGLATGGSSETPDAGTQAHGYELAVPADWFDDYLVLPPRFAPGLPLTGGETTREPPGLYEPTSEHFFSYAFLWRLEGSPTLDAENLRSDLSLYYQGLCGAATVTLAQAPIDTKLAARAPTARFSGTLETGSCFDNATPIARLEVTTYDCPDYPSVLTLISSFPEASAISQELAALRDGFDCY